MQYIFGTSRRWQLSALIVAVLACTACAPLYMYDQPVATNSVARPASVSSGTIDFSYLSRHGAWARSARYGTVWVPTANQSPGWRPYYLGQWDYTRYGWTWVSSESWGWGPYHYGRWAWDSMYRWVWIPGYTWGPAWVSWRSGGGCVGWAPLGPRGVVYNQPTYWTFVNQGSMYRTPIRRVVVQPTRSGVVYTQSVRIGTSARVRGSGGRVVTYNAGPRPKVVSTWTGRPVATRSVSRMPTVRPRAYARPAARAGRRAPAYRAAPTTRPGPGVRGPTTRMAPTTRPYTPRMAPATRAPATRPAAQYRPSRPVTTRPTRGYRPPTRAVAPRAAPAPGRSAPGYRRSSPYRAKPKNRSSSRSSSRSSRSKSKSESRGSRR